MNKKKKIWIDDPKKKANSAKLETWFSRLIEDIIDTIMKILPF